MTGWIVAQGAAVGLVSELLMLGLIAAVLIGEMARWIRTCRARRAARRDVRVVREIARQNGWSR